MIHICCKEHGHHSHTDEKDTPVFLVNTYFLSARLSDLWPFPTGVASGPLRPTCVLAMESNTFCGIVDFPSGPMTGVTSTGSQSIGACQSDESCLVKLTDTQMSNDRF